MIGKKILVYGNGKNGDYLTTMCWYDIIK